MFLPSFALEDDILVSSMLENSSATDVGWPQFISCSYKIVGSQLIRKRADKYTGAR
jgi:hypothetical protein